MEQYESFWFRLIVVLIRCTREDDAGLLDFEELFFEDCFDPADDEYFPEVCFTLMFPPTFSRHPAAI